MSEQRRMKYATEQSFGGQRASIGRTVVIVSDGRIYAGIVYDIALNDQPIIRPIVAASADDEVMSFIGDFWPSTTEAGLMDAPDGSWAWPPKV